MKYCECGHAKQLHVEGCAICDCAFFAEGVAPKKHEAVNHPSHYTTGKYEVIDVLEDWQLGFCEGNVVKYVARAKHKGKELEDLKKARFYLNYHIAALAAKQPGSGSSSGSEQPGSCGVEHCKRPGLYQFDGFCQEHGCERH